MAILLYHEVDVPGLPEKFFISFLNDILFEEKRVTGDISYIFVNDDKILELNKQYLSHDYYTDVIAFDYSEEDIIQGDIFISIPTVQFNANKFSCPFTHELSRVMIHGLLHLIGYTDNSPEEKSVMRRKEDYYLKRINFL